MNPEELLPGGCRLLDAVLAPHGFQFRLGSAGRGSGGHFVTGEYVRGKRALAFSLRWSLGLVMYSIGTVCVSHEALMRGLGVHEKAAYPGFSDEPLDGFRHLATDLTQYAGIFLTGSDEDLRDLLSSAMKLESERPKGIRGLP